MIKINEILQVQSQNCWITKSKDITNAYKSLGNQWFTCTQQYLHAKFIFLLGLNVTLFQKEINFCIKEVTCFKHLLDHLFNVSKLFKMALLKLFSNPFYQTKNITKKFFEPFCLKKLWYTENFSSSIFSYDDFLKILNIFLVFIATTIFTTLLA